MIRSDGVLAAFAVSMLAMAFAGSAASARPPRPAQDADARAAAIESRMTAEERFQLVRGVMALPFGANVVLPADAIPGAGYVPGVPRLAVPPLKESDASLGVAWVGGLRRDGATALPSGLAMASTWNPALIGEGGAMIGGEARAKGFNVLLGGGVNLMRDPRNGRNFEYFGEDPLLAGTLVGAAIAGTQRAGVISTVKHFALNDQETGRQIADVRIGDAAARESDLLAFQLAIEGGRPGSVMCSYNRVRAAYGCGNDPLLDRVLKRDWGYPGFVMSDWGAVHGVEDALAGLDQQSGSQLDAQPWFGAPLAAKVKADPAYAARLRDMNRRILRSMIEAGLLDRHDTKAAIDFAADGEIARKVAAQGIVLLRNKGVLPLAAGAKRIAVIGGYADTGVLSGGGSSQVAGEGGPAALVPLGGEGPFAAMHAAAYLRSAPLAAIRARAPQASVTYDDGAYPAEAARAAAGADVAIVFATQWMSEGFDAPDLSLPNGQDALVAAVAAANPNTIVVLETGGPVAMPWLDRTAAVLEAWYPGARGGEAIADVLFGMVNPSGRLPATFPASVAQLPRPRIPGWDEVDKSFIGMGKPGQTVAVDYDVEGADVGYRWFARKGTKPLFAFGHGLSYTRFRHEGLRVTGGAAPTVEMAVTNIGARAGDDVVQAYLLGGPGGLGQRLVGFSRVSLQPGETRRVSLPVDRRLLARWDEAAHGWRVAAGTYRIGIGESAAEVPLVATVRLGEMRFGPR